MLLAGCATYRISIPAYPLHPAAPAVDRFTAGAGKTEITPPPGIPLGGHGPGGRVARGYWTRLYARSFYFDDGRDHHLALVSAELFAIPAGLHAKVLEAVNRRQRLRPEDLVLAATHTHHGPANFASAEIYNSFAGPLPHFDPVLLDFLAGRIADAVVASIADAQTHAGRPHELRFYRGGAPGIQRNRAIAPFFHNPEALRAAIFEGSRNLGATCPDGTALGCPRYLATDPPCKSSRSFATALPAPCSSSSPSTLPPSPTTPTSTPATSPALPAPPSKPPRGLTRLPWISGAVCREWAGSPVCPRFPVPGPGSAFPAYRRLLQRRRRRHLPRLAGAGSRRRHTSRRPPRSSAARILQSAPLRTETNPLIEVRRKTVANSWRDTDGIGFVLKPMAGAAEPGGAEDGRTLFLQLRLA